MISAMSTHRPTRRTVLQATTIGAAGLVGLTARAADPLLFAINEGVTYQNNPLETQDRYQPILDELSKALKVPVKAVVVAKYDELQKGLADHRFALAYVHPAHHAIRALNGGYRLAALTKGFTEYRASFFVASNSPLKSLADLKGARIGAPDEDSITSVLMRATLRDAGIGTNARITYVRFQDAVPFMVEHGLASVGVSAAKSVLKQWQDNGGKVIASSKPVPIKQVIVSGKAPASTLERVSEYFQGLDQAKDGKARLDAMRVTGFTSFDEEPLRAIGRWLAAG